MKSWYLLYCKRGQQLRAKDHLERQGVNSFSPTISLEKLVRGKRAWVEEPLFPNYVFIELDPEIVHTTTISATRGVSHFIRFGNQPATVPQEVVAALQNEPARATATVCSLAQPGDAVVITDGTFEGLQAIYAEADGETRSILLLTLLSKQVSRSIGNCQFKKL